MKRCKVNNCGKQHGFCKHTADPVRTTVRGVGREDYGTNHQDTREGDRGWAGKSKASQANTKKTKVVTIKVPGAKDLIKKLGQSRPRGFGGSR